MKLTFGNSSFAVFIFYALLVVTSLNIFRSSKLYLVLYALLSLSVIIYFPFNSPKFWPKKIIEWMIFLYILASGYVAVLSFFGLNWPDFLNAATRFYFVYPLFISALLCINLHNLRVAILIYLIISVAAALSLVYQVYFGPVPYFVEHSNRAGIPRYATFLGALPTFGVAGGFALLFIGFVVKSVPIFGVLFFLIFTGLILTLQKAALANFVIILIFMFWLSWKGKLCASPAKLFGIFLTSCALNFFAANDYVLVNLDFMGIKLHRSNGDLIGWTGYGMGEDARKRATNYFLESHTSTASTSTASTSTAVSTLGPVLFGVGYQALGGALGLDKYPMSHNGFVDIWRLGGLLYMAAFLLLFFSIALEIKRLKFLDEYSWYAFAFFALFALNFIFYTGIFVNPALAMLFWINLAYLSVGKNVD